MNEICLIFPYFGKLHPFFELFLECAKRNRKIDFLFFVDDPKWCNLKKYEDNVFFKKIDLKYVKEKISKTLGFDCVLENPYKLCDYKPVYNLIFEECKNYNFWGFADTDLIFGNLDNFLQKIDFQKYSIIGRLGHLTIIKNDSSLTNEFLEKNRSAIREVYSSSKNFGFDEKEFSYFNVFKKSKKHNVFDLDKYISDVRPQYLSLKRHFFTDKGGREFLSGKKFYFYNDGHLFAVKKVKNEFKFIELVYVHFQKRPMRISRKIDSDSFYIKPNIFISKSYKTNFKAFKSLTRFSLKEFILHEIFWLKFYFKHFKNRK